MTPEKKETDKVITSLENTQLQIEMSSELLKFCVHISTKIIISCKNLHFKMENEDSTVGYTFIPLSHFHEMSLC